ncbi:MAG: hypothetical protein VYD19_05070, partial [Myxococcota bacterium]|nr:hypothetical protein [Myxococcota bacterium]
LRDWGNQRGRSSVINMTGEESGEEDDPSMILTLLEEGAARVLGSERRHLWRARGGLPWSEAFQRILIQWLQLSERQRVPFSGLLAEQLRLLELEPLRWNTARRGRPQAIPPVEGLLLFSLVGGLALAMVLDQGALLGLLFGFFSGVILTRRPRYKCPAPLCGARSPARGRCACCGLALSPAYPPIEIDILKNRGNRHAEESVERPSEPGLILYPSRAPQHGEQTRPRGDAQRREGGHLSEEREAE